MADRPTRSSSARRKEWLRHGRTIAASEALTFGFVIIVVALWVLFRGLLHAGLSGEVVPVFDFAAAVGGDFLQYVAFSLPMLLVIEPVRRVGPAGGARRIGALMAAVLLAAAVTTTARLSWWLAQNPESAAPSADDPSPDPLWAIWLSIYPNFALLGAVLVAVGEFHRREIRSLEAMRAAEASRAALDGETLQARLKTLEAQIEPHFLFNTLANVRRLYETDRDTGEAMMDCLMRYLRVALPSMRSDHPTLDREAQLIESYLELQQVRMGRRLVFAVDIAPALRPIEIPSMMLLTLVENAVKHGLAPLRDGGRVDVGARLEGRDLCIEVADTGRGFGGDTSGGGTGLANIRARLKAMFGSAAELTLVPRRPRGLLATIRLPAST